MRYLIVYGTEYGQTRKICSFMKEYLIRRGGSSDIVRELDVTEKTPRTVFAEGFDEIIIGAPVYAGRFPKKLTTWLRHHRGDLYKSNVSLFTVSLNAADERKGARKADDELLVNLIKISGVGPTFVASIAGALKYTAYGFLKRFIMKRISQSAGGPTNTKKDFEMTDWQEVENFLEAICTQDTSSKYYFPVRFPSRRFGMTTVKVEPRPTSLETKIEPPQDLTIL